LGAVEKGMEIHKDIIRSGLEFDVYVGSALVDMYAKCGSMDKARDLFDRMPQRNVVSWNTMISAYARDGPAAESLNLFSQMQEVGIMPNQFTFSSVLTGCAKLGALQEGMKIHEEVVMRGFECNDFVGNGLIDMYAKCGCLEKARYLFDRMRGRDLVSWNAMIAGCDWQV
jgi:pentatricopeptide repeat protein